MDGEDLPNKKRRKLDQSSNNSSARESPVVRRTDFNPIDEDEKDLGDEDPISQHVNDHIYLIFEDRNSKSERTVHPTFAHQLFHNEELNYLTREEMGSLEIIITINCANLAHSVQIKGIDNPEYLERIKYDLSKGLPSDAVYITDKTKEETVDDVMNEMIPPPGKLVRTFTGKDENRQPKEFCLYLSTFEDLHANKLLTRGEKIAMWFIETADSVDFSDPRWELLLLYEKDSKNALFLVGYMTLFTFHNPIHGDNVRVCQALLFPQKQHLGLGRELLLTVYELAEQRENVIQVTVEDPSPGFQRLRNAVDFEWLVRKYSLSKKESNLNEIKKMSVNKMCEFLKITKLQSFFVKEATEYIRMIHDLQLQQNDNNNNNSNTSHSDSPSQYSKDSSSSQQPLLSSPTANSKQARNTLRPHEYLDSFLSSLHELANAHSEFVDFRLTVKKNLVKNDQELKALEKEQLQSELVNAFEEKMMKYRGILKTALRLNLVEKEKLRII
jgi:hypothetical protein